MHYLTAYGSMHNWRLLLWTCYVLISFNKLILRLPLAVEHALKVIIFLIDHHSHIQAADTSGGVEAGAAAHFRSAGDGQTLVHEGQEPGVGDLSRVLGGGQVESDTDGGEAGAAGPTRPGTVNHGNVAHWVIGGVFAERAEDGLTQLTVFGTVDVLAATFDRGTQDADGGQARAKALAACPAAEQFATQRVLGVVVLLLETHHLDHTVALQAAAQTEEATIVTTTGDVDFAGLVTVQFGIPRAAAQAVVLVHDLVISRGLVPQNRAATAAAAHLAHVGKRGGLPQKRGA